MTKPLLTLDNLVSAPIEEGDAGFILKPNGEFKIFSTGAINAENMTAAQRAQGEKLLALACAVAIPEVMNMLIQMSRDPAIVGDGIDIARVN
ncbi:hypothetical protein FV222_00265 [Methylobacterium sp. WL103]|uniref:hypothetical protein n=1 Tax=Methylobacterium sp. WL103 TaxID=2603891 RepID=UPI0011C77FCD|nr:hypothetical protein [Methylobacterium sp. WL103]TXN08939.1 hypothetical protein FV222_00265 [Methylobacterium sp. WL103]